MKTFSGIEIKENQKYYAIERNKFPSRFMEVLVIEIIEGQNRVLVDFPYIVTANIELLPQELFATKKEILKYLDCGLKHLGERDEDGYFIKYL